MSHKKDARLKWVELPVPMTFSKYSFKNCVEIESNYNFSLKILVNLKSMDIYYRNEIYLFVFYRCVNSGDLLTN